ncbi:IMPACT family protein [Ornithinimicrobium pekingense]|uniref:YigZ family protein n=1 Tax=Ornithinimicrobium pekingense TaxID=384677 RepID=A0ABQ2FDA5_9MICO|nr:YigZ family protein [Ornithinimicrobium pekingense]GGK78027.1 YigZ family protein [Ornithinimicrobium pekingense]
MQPSSYRTVAAPVVARTEEKRSVFECWLRRADDEAAARAVVEEARTTHWDARHHCSAFVLGPDGATVRSNDDGEPAGTAGTPMLQVLTSSGLTDVIAVVTRWFGGTLLGTGGLVRAYSDAVRAAVEEAEVLTRVRVREVDVRVGHDLAGRLEHDLRARGIGVPHIGYADRVTLRVQVPVVSDAVAADDLPGLLAGLTSGEAQIVPGSEGEGWLDVQG